MSSRNSVLEVARATNRKVGLLKSFRSSKDFVAISNAEQFLKDGGYSVGSMQRDFPIAAAKGKMYVAKWCNIDTREWPRVEVMIVSADMRNGPVVEVYSLLSDATEAARRG